MDINNGSPTVEVPLDIKVAIENYKNQATLLGLEVTRLQKLKSQIEISVSNLTSMEVSKIEKNRLLDEKINKQVEQIEGFERKKAELLKERMEFDQHKFEVNKKLDEREVAVKRIEADLAGQKNSLDKRQKTIESLVEKYEIDQKEIQKKERLIEELIKKL